MYWDFNRTLLNSMLVVIFAISGTAAVLLNTIAQNPNLWWAVYGVAPIFLVILLVTLGRILRSFRILAGKVEGYLKKVEAGEKIPDLQELIELGRKSGLLSRLLVGKKSTSSSGTA